MKNKMFTWLLMIPFTFSSFAMGNTAEAAGHMKTLPTKMEGSDIIQYVDPMSHEKYTINNSSEMLDVIRMTALGISNYNISHIKIAPSTYSGVDSDGDGLADRIEDSLGTDKLKMDTDGDGFNDLEEINKNHNPLGTGNTAISNSLSKNLAGKILLQVEQNGEAWYVHPTTYERHYLGSA